MIRKDFKEINKEHIATCKELILHNGNCEEVDCEKCPFISTNSIDGINKCENGMVKTLKIAKEFLEICEETGAIIGEGTAEKSVSGEVPVDNINSPKHYRLPGLNIESIDIIRAILGKYFKWFCLGNIIKYILRAEKKNGLEDYKKARKYLNWLIEGEEK